MPIYDPHAIEAKWHEFWEKGEDLIFKARQILADKQGKSLDIQRKDSEVGPSVGRYRKTTVKTRIGQSFFRAAVLSSYNWTCCVTGLKEVRLLNASHIVPWANDSKNRVNPSNGLCLNALHDRAFDRGLMTISEDYCVVFASEIHDCIDEATKALLLKYNGKSRRLPISWISAIS